MIVFIFSAIYQILLKWKEKEKMFMYFGSKHVEVGHSCSHELAAFLKFHIPLRGDYTLTSLFLHVFQKAIKK